MEKRHLTFSILVERAEDVPGLWVAHCLDNDIVSTGNSPREAQEMVQRAVLETFLDDVVHKFDFHDRKGAPEDCWKKFSHIVSCGLPATEIPENTDAITGWAALVQMIIAYEVVRTATELQPTLEPDVDLLPKEDSEEWPDIQPLRVFNHVGAETGACQHA